LTAQAKTALKDYQWPGNIRELSHVIERATILSDSAHIEVADLGLAGTSTQDLPLSSSSGESDTTLAEMEKRIITARLDYYGKDGVKTAKSLGLSKSAFYRHLAKHQID